MCDKKSDQNLIREEISNEKDSDVDWVSFDRISAEASYEFFFDFFVELVGICEMVKADLELLIQ